MAQCDLSSPAIGHWYTGKSGPDRQVIGLSDDSVMYIIRGLLTFAPLKMTVEEFSTWANDL
ncbi:hypothetical protein C8J42_101921 [Sphingomonas sp. PP-CE-1A-559]|nr:hypothetical protein C8J42_101921 [Sphingomonas sp. PP-CE-1A-559]